MPRSIFPCQDTPSVRFTYSAEVEVPQGLVAAMAAEQIGVEEGSGHGSTVFRFRMPQPIPSYLFALAVGNLDFRELGPRTGVYAEPETIEAAAWEFAENETKIIEAEKLLGPYLWGRYDLLVLPPSFPYGGMENPRLTFLTPTAILGTRGQLVPDHTRARPRLDRQPGDQCHLAGFLAERGLDHLCRDAHHRSAGGERRQQICIWLSMKNN